MKRNYSVWIHSASLGEVKVALRFVEDLIKIKGIKKSDIVITTTTLTAKRYAKNFIEDVYLLPIDYYFLARNFVKIVRPKIFIITETELWPNYILLAKKFGGKVFLINGRITKKTFIFVSLFKWLYKKVFDSIDYFLVREDIDYIRFSTLGIESKKILLTGNIKYDSSENLKNYINRKNLFIKEDELLVVFGSVRDKEEKQIIDLIEKFESKENIKFILVPRHLKLIKRIIKLLDKKKIKYQMRTKVLNGDYKCLIVNTYGELVSFYAIADICVVCGSFIDYGGQSIIEPAKLGKLVVFGPYIQNFLHTAKVLLENNAAIQANNILDIKYIILDRLKNSEKYFEISKRAIVAVSKLTGAVQKSLDIILNTTKFF
ncbi:MAG: hypothetical protein N2643_00415 [Endomicrobia bacterium]|nr:hypothetical protein [Endomicrobiia bacterium]